MKTNESFGEDIKSEFTNQLSKNVEFNQSGLDGILTANDFKNAIPESNDFEKTKITKKPMKKGVMNKLVSKTKINKPIGKLTTGLPIMGEEQELDEKWSEKYKNSIDCSNPKGFSQKAHCQGRKKENKESTGSGSAGGFSAPLFSETKQEMQEKCWKGYKEVGGKMKNGKMVPNCVKEGTESDVKKVEATEATGSGSSGSYETTSAWAKSTKKKDWGGRKKTQIPGGKFVQVKKKCKKFPYCNQGDIKALKIFENEKVKQAIQNISKRHNISENVIKTIIAYEYENSFPKK